MIIEPAALVAGRHSSVCQFLREYGAAPPGAVNLLFP